MCTTSSLPNMTINSHGEIPAEKKPRGKPHYLKVMVTFNSPNDCKNPIKSESPYYNIMVSTYNLPHIFLTNISRNWFCKTNPTISVFRAWQVPNSTLSRKHKITINRVQLAFGVSYTETKLLVKYSIAIAA